MTIARVPPLSRVGLLAAIVVAQSIAGCASTPPQRQVRFAPSVAWENDQGDWRIEIHGRIYESSAGSPWRTWAAHQLAKVVGVKPEDPQYSTYQERAGYYLSDSAAGAVVTVELGSKTYKLQRAEASGYVHGDFTLTRDEVRDLVKDGTIKDGIATFKSVDPPLPASPSAIARLIPPKGLTVITDMDDTIKDTVVYNHAVAKANTFVLPFRPVCGMPELYQAWNAAGGAAINFHVVSAGPWHFQEPLQEFTQEAHFPDFTWHMRSVDITDPEALIAETYKPDPRRLYAFKVAAIREYVERFPDRHLVLVGDSAERDPEVYATILHEHYDRVDAVFIHDVTGEPHASERFKACYPGIAFDKLQVFEAASELPRQLTRASGAHGGSQADVSPLLPACDTSATEATH